MPKNVMKMLKPSPNYGRNDFDLSHRTVHTANFGELIPSFCIETLPKDKIKVRVSDLARAQPMVTSPFLRAKQHVDVWFVPYNMMWSRFNEFMMGKSEPSSSALKDRLYVPKALLSGLQTALGKWEAATPLTDVHGRSPVDSIYRNLELLGYPGNMLSGGNVNYDDVSVNLWRIMAYNLIWYREYRQQYYDDGKLNIPTALSALDNGASFLFNMDYLQCNTLLTSDITSIGSPGVGIDLLAAMIQPRYRLWKKDIYTGLMPDTQFGNVSVIPNNVYSELSFDSSTFPSAKYLGTQANDNVVGLYNNSSPGTFYSRNFNISTDILALRKSEAIQRWRENSLRAGNQIEDNWEAHYGVKPKSHLQYHPIHVTSFDAPLNIGDVNATASTGESENNRVGDVAGKGILSFNGNDEFTFETNDFGVLMGIYSILPEAEYNGNNLDRMNALLEREDYFFPEYENLGLELVDSSVISCNNQQNFGLGYAPRYFGYKQKHDRCVGRFMQYQGYNGLFRHWCSPKYDVDSAINSGTLPLSTLYVNPNIFGVNFDISDYLTVDQFLVDMYVDCEAIRQMSVSGMPGY